MTVATLPSAAAGWLNVVVATPVASKITLVCASDPALVLRVAVVPLTAEKALVQGLLASAQAVIVTVVGRHVMLLEASESS
jgi:hypothetical protein